VEIDFIPPYLQDFLANIRYVLLSPFQPGSRIYFLYLATSALFAFFVYLALRRARSPEATSFLGYLFPKRIWSHPSAWLDVRYFFFHGITGHFIATSGGVAVTLGVFTLLTGQSVVPDADSGVQVLTGWQGVSATIAFMVVAIVVSDFTAFYMHYLQHKIPLLWQFHKVHHSAEVMHPLSNFREHPIDNFAYSVTIGATYGVVLALMVHAFGYVPHSLTLLGVPVFMFLFNVTGYNLRHSHVWLRWPGRWSVIFPSPAHHQVHHSCHPDHLDKNFAFMCPVWDVLFGCYVMPEDNRDVKFGVTEKDRGHELNSCVRMYALPFRDAWRVMTKGRAAIPPTPAAETVERAEVDRPAANPAP
jgi:sterol desaturase/sphingolipid hydroxylase (fatty acid hydroxylase superfamily)